MTCLSCGVEGWHVVNLDDGRGDPHAYCLMCIAAAIEHQTGFKCVGMFRQQVAMSSVARLAKIERLQQRMKKAGV